MEVADFAYSESETLIGYTKIKVCWSYNTLNVVDVTLLKKLVLSTDAAGFKRRSLERLAWSKSYTGYGRD